MYTLAMTIDYRYWKRDCKYHHAKQVEKKSPTLESKEKLPPPVLPRPPRTRQIYLW